MTILVGAIHHLERPDWPSTLIGVGSALVAGELAVLLVAWMRGRWDLGGEDLELVLDERALTLRRPGLVNTVEYRRIWDVRGHTLASGEVEAVEVFWAKATYRLHGFENMRAVYDQLAEHTGIRDHIVRHGAWRPLRGPWAALLGGGVTLAIIAWRRLGPGWSLSAEVVYQLVPAAIGLWLLVGRPLRRVLVSPTLETVMGVLLMLSSAAVIWVTAHA